MKKYELDYDYYIATEDGLKLYRIRALRDIESIGVKTGDLGGFIESEDNLSQKGDCWVFDSAKVIKKAKVSKNAIITDQAIVMDSARVTDNATVGYFAIIKDKAKVSDCANISGFARICHHAKVYGSAKIFGNGIVEQNGEVGENALVSDYGRVTENGKVFGRAMISGHATVLGCAEVSGSTFISHLITLEGNAKVESNDDWFFIQNVLTGITGNTFFKCSDGKIRVYHGSEVYDLDAFEARLKNKDVSVRKRKEFKMAIRLAVFHIIGE